MQRRFVTLKTRPGLSVLVNADQITHAVPSGGVTRVYFAGGPQGHDYLDVIETIEEIFRGSPNA